MSVRSVQAQVPTTITYQGYLTDAADTPLTETNATLFLRLYDADEFGKMVWFEKQTGVAVNNGVFAVQLGSVEPLTSQLLAEPLFLSIALGGEEAEELSPRVPLTAVPYSLRSAQLDPAALKAGTNVSIVPDADGALVITAESGRNADAWQLGGNAGTTPGADFMGTTDEVPLEIRVNEARVLRLEPETDSEGPNVILGARQNGIGKGVAGATVAGGGDPDVGGIARPNQVRASYGAIGGGAGNTTSGVGATVGGGTRNEAAGSQATIGGGLLNTAGEAHAAVGGGIDNAATGRNSTVGGGSNNEARASAGTVGGGANNDASGLSSTVGGGLLNVASGTRATVPGGMSNHARGDFSFAAGFNARAITEGSFVWSDNSRTAGDSLVATSPYQFLIRAVGGVGIGTNAPSSPLTVAGIVESTAGGFKLPDGTVLNEAEDLSGGSAWQLGGNAGTDPTADFLGTTDFTPLELRANGQRVMRFDPARGGDGPNVIGGWSRNFVTSGVVGATIAGGGAPHSGGPEPNRVTANYGTVGGGTDNTAGGRWATVSGGDANGAGGVNATVGGGFANTASGASATVAGGLRNAVVFAQGGTIGGGEWNAVRGRGATVPGGEKNRARGDYSFAAGYYAVTRGGHDGSFVWSDNSQSAADSLVTTAPHQFLVRAAGGVGLGTNTPATQLHTAAARNGSDQDPAQHVALIENTSTGTSADVLALKTGRSVDPGPNVNFVTFFDGSENVVGQIQGNGSGGVAFVSASADFAEYLPRLKNGEHIQPGDVVGVSGGRVTKQTDGAERVMVVSNRAIVEGNMPKGGDTAGHELIALLGQVPVRMRGPVAMGDFVVPSGRDDGTARALSPDAMTLSDHAQVIGRAWTSADGAGEQRVIVAVGLDRVGALVDQLQRQQTQIEELRRRQVAQTEQFQRQQAQIDALLARIDASRSESR